MPSRNTISVGIELTCAALASVCCSWVSTRAEGQVRVGLGGRLVDRSELAAGAAPARPEIHEQDVVLRHPGLEVVAGQLGRGRGATFPMSR